MSLTNARMCVISVNMKTATTREVQHHFSKVLKWVDAGEEVVITRRGKSIATLAPMNEAIDPMEKKVDWAAVIEERQKALGDLPKSMEDTVQKMREMERY